MPSVARHSHRRTSSWRGCWNAPLPSSSRRRRMSKSAPLVSRRPSRSTKPSVTSRAAQVHSRLGTTYALPEHGTELDIPRALEHLAAAAPVLGHRRDRGGAYFLVAHAGALMRDLRLDEAHVASEQALAIAEQLV